MSEQDPTGTPPESNILGSKASAPTEQPPAPTPPTSPVGGNGNPPEASWRDQLPDELKNDPSLATFKDVASLAKSLVHAQKAIGKEKIVIPGKHATDQDWAEVYKKLGLPETLDKYEIKATEGVDEKFLAEFKKVAHQTGVLPKSAQALLDWSTGFTRQAIAAKAEADKSAQAQGLSQLKQEWGQGWDNQVAKAQAAVEEYGLDEFIQKKGLGNDPDFIRVMAKVGAGLAEDKIKGQGGQNYGLTPDEAQRQINAIYADPKHPVFDKSHPNHKIAVEDMSKLFALKSGQKA